MDTRRKLTLLFVLGFTLFACTQHPAILAWIDEQEISVKQYQDFLSFKQLTDSEEETDKYIGSEALALAIEKSAIYQNSLLSTEISERRKAWLSERYFQLFLEENLNDEAIRRFYESDDNPFVEPKVSASHILIRTHKSMSLDDRRAAYDKAEELYQQLKRGADFAQMASQHSDDSLTASKGGSLGYLSENDVSQQFSDTAFKQLKVGEISKPFQSRFGFHILTLTAEKEFIKRPLPEVENLIKQRLKADLYEQEMQRLLSTVNIKRSSS